MRAASLTLRIARQRCMEKIAYVSWEHAERAALSLHEDIRDGKLPILKGGTVFAYECPFGSHWHIGHQNPRAISKIRAALRKEANAAIGGGL